jgi:DNA-binding transcriptional MerR regulator
MLRREYTLDDLVRLTGFSKRQIRFYITKRLAPGAGDRGPNAAYDEETLRRLRLIAQLKDKRIEPTGRAMTLDEIGHALNALDDDSIDALVAGRTELTIVDTEAGSMRPLGMAMPHPDEDDDGDGDGVPLDSAAEFLARMREDEDKGGGVFDEPRGMRPEEPQRSFDEFASVDFHRAPAFRKLNVSYSPPKGGEDTPDPLSDLLTRLQATLAELGSDTRFTTTARDGEQWLRVTTPDVEFHVRKPDEHRARQRLLSMAQALGRLLAREE